MLEFVHVDDETIYAVDETRHEVEKHRAILIKYEDWVFDTESCDSLLTSDNLRQIADKLDELNGQVNDNRFALTK